MQFKKYMHIERYNTDEVEDIQLGHCFVFPKLDGTNSSVWLDDDSNLACGSRNRVLTLDNDNAGFMAAVVQDDKFKKYLEKHPTHRLYGEWLVPHTLKTYREDAWQKFYVFDVTTPKTAVMCKTCKGSGSDIGPDGPRQCVDCLGLREFEQPDEYIPYNVYKQFLDEFKLDYIEPQCEAKNCSYEQFVRMLDANTFLIKDGMGAGEGIVIKNYDFYNKYGRQVWAKIVRTEFKEQNKREFGAAVIKGEKMVEEDIIAVFCTEALIDKVHAKILTDKGTGWRSEYIPQLLQTVFYDMVREDIWAMIKKYKNPKIDFKVLNALCIKKIKEHKPEIFS